MHGRKILNVTFSTLTQKEETFKRPGPTAKMRRNKRNNMDPTGTIPYLFLEREDSRWQEKDGLCPVEIPYRMKQEQNPKEILNYLKLNSVYSMIANVGTLCTIVMKPISEE